jgi:hypothetical protein
VKSALDESRELGWIKIYSCDAYHDSINSHFKALRGPQHPRSALI